ncbi:MAG: hypothetical protein ABJE63_11885 [Lentilitoribacter sp.]
MKPDLFNDVFVVTGYFVEHHIDFYNDIDRNYPFWERRFIDRLVAKGVKRDEIAVHSRWTRSGKEIKLVKTRGHIWTYFPLKKNKTIWVTGPRSIIQQMDILPKREI